MFGFVKIAVHPASREQGSVEIIGPAMIGADQLG